MSMAFGYTSGYESNSDRPLPPPLKCKVCAYEYHPSAESFDSPVSDACPKCTQRKTQAEMNSRKLALAKESKDVLTPATFAQLEELIALQKDIAHDTKATKNSVRGLQWAIFGMFLISFAATLLSK